MEDIIHVVSLTDKQLLKEIFIAIKNKCWNKKNDARIKWLLTNKNGHLIFASIAKKAARMEMNKNNSTQWVSMFQHAYDMEMSLVGEDTAAEAEAKEKSKAFSTGQLLDLAMREIPKDSFYKRLSTAIQMINKNNNNKNKSLLSVYQASCLVKASSELQLQRHTEEEQDVTISLQTDALTILLHTISLSTNNNHKNVNNDNNNKNNLYCALNNVLASIQLPLLQKLNSSVCEQILNIPQKLSSSLNTLQKITSLKTLRHLEAAELARKGDQIGSKHGCVICVPNHILSRARCFNKSSNLNTNDTQLSSSSYSSQMSFYEAVVGKGWNHNIFLNGRPNGGRKRVIHSECHAIADTIQTFGEDIAFSLLFPNAICCIVELVQDVSYDNAPPCPKCDTLLRAVGCTKICHSTKNGFLQDDVTLAYSDIAFLDRDTVRIPFRTVCDELGVDCLRLVEAEDRAKRRRGTSNK